MEDEMFPLPMTILMNIHDERQSQLEYLALGLHWPRPWRSAAGMTKKARSLFGQVAPRRHPGQLQGTPQLVAQQIQHLLDAGLPAGGQPVQVGAANGAQVRS